MTVLFGPGHVFAEGSAQLGPYQSLKDYSKATSLRTDEASSLYVDIIKPGEVIHTSLCGTSNSDSLSVRIFNPAGAEVFDSGSVSANLDCDAPADQAPVNTIKYEATEVGAYRLVLENLDELQFERFDISVANDINSLPDSNSSRGRLWSYSWNLNSNSFSEQRSTDAAFYALIPGGWDDSNYIWKLDLNNFAGWEYDIVANDTGIDKPGSGYSAPREGHSVHYQFPLYLGVPANAKPQPTSAPNLADIRFIDDEGEDFSFSPSSSEGFQDSGFFEFSSDVTGNYALAIDLNMNGIYGDTGDTTLLGQAKTGLNKVRWDGLDSSGRHASAGTYTAAISVRLGEYHFIAEDVETSGGGVHATDPTEGYGLTIFEVSPDGTESDTLVYWDDKTLLGSGSSNTPFGALSSTAEGIHAWGDFSGEGIGNNSYIDTYVYGLQTTATTLVQIADDEQPGTDGIPDYPDVDPGDSTDPESDRDGDGLPDFRDEDIDGDGISNNAEGLDKDSDGDGIVDALDLDSDDDLITDRTESTVDTDNDGVPNYLDLDSDNDSLMDIIESGAPTNVDSDNNGRFDGPTGNNGISDQWETSPDSGFVDYDQDGVADLPVDTDRDGAPDYIDLDTDNDGLSDLREITDENAPDNGMLYPFTDENGDGADDNAIPAMLPVPDTDGDRIPDHRDLDSDQDSLSDLIESEGIDLDRNGRVDEPVDNNADGMDDILQTNPPAAPDPDGDGFPDYIDLDSDDNGVSDLIESGKKDERQDGIVDSLVDTDGNGVADVADAGFTGGSDLDSDNIDDIADADQASESDLDGDGIVDAYDADANGDGMVDSYSFAAASGEETSVDSNEPVLYTGLGGGCSLATTGASGVDPLFPGIVFISALGLFARRKKSILLQSTKRVILAGTCVLFSIPAGAVSTDWLGEYLEPHLYIGLGMGRSTLKPDSRSVDYSVLDNKDTAYNAVFGVDLFRYLSGELQFNHLGKAKLEPEGDVTYRVFGASALFYSPAIADRGSHRTGLRLFGRIGTGVLDNSSSVKYEQKNGYHLLTGVGLEYGTLGPLAFRLEYTRYDRDAHYAGLGVIVRTGTGKNKKVEEDKRYQVTLPAMPLLPAIAVNDDEDADGVPDVDDKCPGTAAGIAVNDFGCEPFNNVIAGITFESGHATLTPAAKEILRESAAVLVARPDVRVTVMAHTDDRGNDQFNMDLSRSRAEAVVLFLIGEGLAKDSLIAESYGETRPIASNETPEGRLANRRVEFRTTQ